MRWIVSGGTAHGPDPDRQAWDPDAEWMDWIEIDADGAAQALAIAALHDDSPETADAIRSLADARRLIASLRSMPYALAADLRPAIAHAAECRSRLDAALWQAGILARRAEPWSEAETLDRRRRWYGLVRAGLSAEEIERGLGWTASELAAAVRRHGLA